MKSPEDKLENLLSIEYLMYFFSICHDLSLYLLPSSTGTIQNRLALSGTTRMKIVYVHYSLPERSQRIDVLVSSISRLRKEDLFLSPFLGLGELLNKLIVNKLSVQVVCHSENNDKK